MTFTDRRRRRAVVPLFAFHAGQRMNWPLDLDGLPWVALNTPGTPTHGRTVLLAERELFVSQRFAIDTVRVDADFNTSNPPDSPHKEDYYAWGQDVLSMGHGRVVVVVNDRPDEEVGSSDRSHPAGNYVVVRHGPCLFSLYAHLLSGSVLVQVGEEIERGQPLGRLGNSGNTTQPHLHLQFMDRWDGLDAVRSVFTSQGLPALFWDASVNRNGQVLPLRGTTPLELDLVTLRPRPTGP
jgi:murein DD-endopeptidase MepM/ murein hydrolase activator NlpD